MIKYFLAAVAVYGQSAWLVKDNPEVVPNGSSPQGAVRMGNALYFAGYSSELGNWALYKFDLTTRRVSSVNEFRWIAVYNDRPLLVVNNRLIFTAAALGQNDGVTWASDGTALGTVVIQASHSTLHEVRNSVPPVVGGFVYYPCQQSQTPYEQGLCRSNGTPGGTTVIRTQFMAKYLVEKGGEVFVAGTDTTTGQTSLWKTDGTAGGTVIVAGAAQGINDIGDLVQHGGALYMNACSSAAGCELWKSDGTTAGTALLADLSTGSSSPLFLGSLGGTLFFYASTPATGEELWKTDGTAAGTVMIADLRPGPIGSFWGVRRAAVANGYLFFGAYLGGSDVRLFRTDGSAAGTQDLGPSNDDYFTALGAAVLYRRPDSATGYELWKSDGSLAGTVLVKDIVPGANSSWATAIGSPVLGRLYLSAWTPSTGQELWESDGTPSGTVLAADIDKSDGGANPSAITSLGGVYYYVARDALGNSSLWRTNGTAAGTTLVKTVNGYVETLHVVGGALVFLSATQGGNSDLWRSDGTMAGTVQVRTIVGGAYDGIVAGGKLFFGVNYTYFGRLWSTDGTLAGTIDTGAELGGGAQAPYAAALADGRLVFTGQERNAQNNVNDNEPWVSDGTAAGTVPLAQTNPTGYARSDFFVRNLGHVYFRSNNGLWKTDGTSTTLVSPNNVGDGPWFALNGEVFFSGLSGGLLKSDGTPGGTVGVHGGLQPIVPYFSVGFAGVASIPGKVLFAGYQVPAGDIELWSTDGTSAVLVKDISPGASSGFPYFFASAGNYAYFMADQEDNGVATDRELWISDGTTAGTKRVADIHPGRRVYATSDQNRSSDPNAWLGLPDGRLLFSAVSPLRGRELWMAHPTACPAPTDLAAQMTITAGAPVFNRNSGRFVQNVSIRNNGAAVDGVAYVLGGLNTAINFLGAHGVTHCATPAGAPYRDVGAIGAGQTVTLALEFIVPAGTPMGYTPKVVAAVDGPR